MRVGIDALIAALERCGGLAPLDARKGIAVDASAELDIARERAKAQRPQPMRKMARRQPVLRGAWVETGRARGSWGLVLRTRRKCAWPKRFQSGCAASPSSISRRWAPPRGVRRSHALAVRVRQTEPEN